MFCKSQSGLEDLFETLGRYVRCLEESFSFIFKIRNNYIQSRVEQQTGHIIMRQAKFC